MSLILCGSSDKLLTYSMEFQRNFGIMVRGQAMYILLQIAFVPEQNQWRIKVSVPLPVSVCSSAVPVRVLLYLHLVVPDSLGKLRLTCS